MPESEPGNLLVVQGGGPTPVFNASLYGVIDEARRRSAAGSRVLGARRGVEGLIAADVVDLTSLPLPQLDLLRRSPGAALGSTRHKLLERDLDQIVGTLQKLDVRRLIVIGGNGSLRGAELIGHACGRLGYDACVVGVPKTIDNDILTTDRCPGFASAARYVAQSVRDLGMDVRTLPQPVAIFETMGRSAGWLAAASVLGRIDDRHAPHLVYLPETPFDLDSFLRDIDDTVRRHGWAVAVVTEGIRNATDEPVYQTQDSSQQDALGRVVPGGIAAHLAGQVTRRLKLRCRWEQPGLCGRTSMLHSSQQDLIDADEVGRAGVRATAAGKQNHLHMVSLLPLDRAGEAKTEWVPLSRTAGQFRHVPAEWLGPTAASPVTDAFLRYVGPLVGELVEYALPLHDRETP
jgi:6-phosphofructokinase 1